MFIIFDSHIGHLIISAVDSTHLIPSSLTPRYYYGDHVCNRLLSLPWVPALLCQTQGVPRSPLKQTQVPGYVSGGRGRYQAMVVSDRILVSYASFYSIILTPPSPPPHCEETMAIMIQLY